MAGGWLRDGAIQEHIDASIEAGIRRARSQLAPGKGSVNCEECDRVIPDDRRKAIAGVRLCITCQSALEKKETHSGNIHRRG